MPEEVYIKRNQMKEALAVREEEKASMKDLLRKINDRCKDCDVMLEMTNEADDLYTEFR